MITNIFSAIILLLKLFGLWEQFADYIDKARIAETEARRQRREKALDDLKNTKTEEDFDKAQSDVVNNPP